MGKSASQTWDTWPFESSSADHHPWVFNPCNCGLKRVAFPLWWPFRLAWIHEVSFFSVFEKFIIRLIQQKTVVNIKDKQGHLIQFLVILSLPKMEIYSVFWMKGLRFWAAAGWMPEDEQVVKWRWFPGGCHVILCPGQHLCGVLVEITWNLKKESMLTVSQNSAHAGGEST